MTYSHIQARNNLSAYTLSQEIGHVRSYTSSKRFSMVEIFWCLYATPNVPESRAWSLTRIKSHVESRIRYFRDVTYYQNQSYTDMLANGGS
jgi:hypothetical protein